MSQLNSLGQITKLQKISQNFQQLQQQQQQANSFVHNFNLNQQIQQQQQQVQLQHLDKPKRNPYCSRCRNHGKSAQVKGHKRHCEYRECQCDGCKLVECRQIVSAAQIKRRRYQKQDEECGRKIEVSPPKLARTTLDTDPATLIAKKLIGTAVAATTAASLDQPLTLPLPGQLPPPPPPPPPYRLINSTHHSLHLHDVSAATTATAATATSTAPTSASLLHHNHNHHHQSYLGSHSSLQPVVAVGVQLPPNILHQASHPLQQNHRLGLLTTAAGGAAAAAASSQLLGLVNSHAVNAGPHLQTPPDLQTAAASSHLNPHLGSVLQQHFFHLWKSQQQQHLSHDYNHHQSQQQQFVSSLSSSSSIGDPASLLKPQLAELQAKEDAVVKLINGADEAEGPSDELDVVSSEPSMFNKTVDRNGGVELSLAESSPESSPELQSQQKQQAASPASNQPTSRTNSSGSLRSSPLTPSIAQFASSKQQQHHHSNNNHNHNNNNNNNHQTQATIDPIKTALEALRAAKSAQHGGSQKSFIDSIATASSQVSCHQIGLTSQQQQQHRRTSEVEAAGRGGSPLPVFSPRDQILLADDLHQQYGLLAVFSWLKAENFDTIKVRSLIESAKCSYNEVLLRTGRPRPT